MPRRLEKKFLTQVGRQPFRPQRKKRGRILKGIGLLLLFSAFGAIFVHFKMNRFSEEVEKKFSLAQRRWNIPSRVYADTEYIYPGVDLAQRTLIFKLEQLGYRRVFQIKGPGDFVPQANAIEIYLHEFSYPQEKFVGFPVRLELEKNVVKKIVDLESSEELPLIRLEPEEIGTLFDEKMEDRTLITLKDCPQHLLEGVIVIEDERFFKHHGVDPIAIVRAAFADLLALKVVQGGSTLTQQLVKNFFLTPQKSFVRKFNEALMALILEKKHSKAEILEAYLNEIYLGQRGPSSVTGMAEASKHYFGKELHQITPAESALLAGMIRSPSEYSPFRNKKKALQRRNFVLKRMLKKELLSEEAYQEAIQEEIVTPKQKIKPVVAPYFIDFLKSQLADLYSEEVLETEGLKIFTTLDMTLQKEAERNLEEGLANLEKQYGTLLPKGYEGKLQGCLAALSPQNGYIRAMVGGKDYAESQFNRCTQALRQPGSTFKPFVYLTALDPSRSEKEFTPASLLDDTTFTIDTPEGPWSPKNYDKKEHGPVTLRDALENSYNIATAKLGMEAGLEKIVETAREAGITSVLNPFPSLALGAFELTPLELLHAYTVFPNLGLTSQPLAVIHVMTPEGKVLEKKALKIKRVFDPAPTALTVSLLQGVIERGTGQAALSYGLGKKTAGKTGTTSDYRDAWFVGFTPDLLSLVWTGYDDNTPIAMSGARAALPIWAAFMKGAISRQTKEWTFPLEIVQVEIDPLTGKRATPQCPETRIEYFIQGTEPKGDCPHRKGKPLPQDDAF